MWTECDVTEMEGKRVLVNECNIWINRKDDRNTLMNGDRTRVGMCEKNDSRVIDLECRYDG